MIRLHGDVTWIVSDLSPEMFSKLPVSVRFDKISIGKVENILNQHGAQIIFAIDLATAEALSSQFGLNIEANRAKVVLSQGNCAILVKMTGDDILFYSMIVEKKED